MIAILKEVLEIPRRKLLRFQVSQPHESITRVIKQIQQNGFFHINNYWNSNQINVAKDAINKLCEMQNVPNSWVDPEMSDHRFFFSERHSPIFNEFRNDEFIESVRKAYTGRKIADKCVLAAKLISKFGNKGSGGGWHMDSPFSLQFKAFLFLSDVTESNGPLEAILPTRSNYKRLQLELLGLKKSGQYRFTNEQAIKIQERTEKAHVFTAKSGDLVLTDTTALHRGKPIISGERYALTLYCGDPNITEKLT